MKTLWTHFLDWTAMQRTVIIVLMLGIIICSSLTFLLPEPKPSVAEDKILQHYLDSLSLIQNQNSTDSNSDNKKVTPTIAYYDFNPNTISLQEWMQFGVSEKIAKRIENYLSKKGHFYKTEDVKKIYDFDDNVYQNLKPYMQIPEQVNGYSKNNLKAFQKIFKEKNIVININTADSKDWEKLKGIGEKTAARILKYKKLLGGFYNLQQIKEVYGMDTLYEKIAAQLIYTPIALETLHLNSDTFKIIMKHPYIGFEMAKKIFRLKKEKGLIKNEALLLENNILDKMQLEKLRPYLGYD